MNCMKPVLATIALASFFFASLPARSDVPNVPGCQVWPNISLNQIKSALDDLRARVTKSKEPSFTQQDAYDADAIVDRFNTGLTEMLQKASTPKAQSAAVLTVGALDEILKDVPDNTTWGDQPRLWRVRFRASALTAFFDARCLKEGIGLAEDSVVLADGYPEVEAELLTNLSPLLLEYGDLRRAEATSLRVLDILPVPTRFSDVQMIVAAHNALGTINRKKGNNLEAGQHYRNAEIFLAAPAVKSIVDATAQKDKRALVEFDRYRAGIAFNMAVALSDSEAPEKLTALYDRALSIREKIHGPDHLEVAAVLRSRAQNALRRGDRESARQDVERALSIVRKAGQPDELARTLGESALQALDARDMPSAIRFAEEIEQLLLAKQLATPAAKIVALRALAQVNTQTGQLAKALDEQYAALLVQKAYAGNVNPGIAEILADAALLLQAMKRSEEALKAARLASSSARLWLDREAVGCQAGDPPRPGLFSKVSEILLATAFDALEGASGAIFEQEEQQRLHEDILLAAQLSLQDRTGAAALRAAVRQRASSNGPAAKHYLELLSKRCALERESLSLRSDAGSAGLWSEHLVELQQQIQLIAKETEVVERDLNERERSLLRSGRSVVNLALARKLLRTNEAALVIMPGLRFSALILLVNRSDGLHVHTARIALTAELIDSTIAIWREKIKTSVKGQAISADAFRNFVKPIEELLLPQQIVDELKGVNHIFFVGEGSLETWPAALIPVPGGYLEDIAPTSTLPSLSTLAAARGDSMVSSSRKLIGIGDPVLNPFMTCKNAEKNGFNVPPKNANHREVLCLGSIPSAPVLFRQLAAIFPTATMLSGPDARRDTVLRLDYDKAGIVVFMTHALTGVSEEISYLKEPALALTPSETDAQDDGLLLASEISNLAMESVWLAVLGACETGAGTSENNNEGFSGLALAFFSAGARAIVVSHWKTQQDSARIIIEDVLLRMSADPRKTLAAALSESGKEMGKKYSDYLSPYHMNAFVVVGDGTVTMPAMNPIQTK
jgi:CHAT domain-containing protein